MLSAITTTKFINWCRDSKNLEMFTNLLHSGRVEISSAMKQFDGAPIFRNTKILITGTFKHGKLSDVADILRSYSADVTTYFQHDISVVVVGDIKENVDGSIVTKARQAGIQICNESEFFNLYKIDEDLKNYL